MRENPPKETRRKTTARDGRGKPGRSSSRIPSEDLFRELLGNLEDIWKRHYEQEELIWQVSGLVGELDLTQLVKAVANAITDLIEISKKQEEINNL